MMMMSFLDSVLRVVLDFLDSDLLNSIRGDKIWMRMDGIYILSGMGGAILAWILFDRRRLAIEKEFSKLKPIDGKAKQVGVAVFSLSLTFAFLYIGKQNPAAGVVSFVAMISLLSFWLEKLANRA
jgi:hypothetical protein